MCCGTFTGIPGLHPLDAGSTPSVATSTNVYHDSSPGEQNCPQLRTTGLVRKCCKKKKKKNSNCKWETTLQVSARGHLSNSRSPLVCSAPDRWDQTTPGTSTIPWGFTLLSWIMRNLSNRMPSIITEPGKHGSQTPRARTSQKTSLACSWTLISFETLQKLSTVLGKLCHQYPCWPDDECPIHKQRLEILDVSDTHRK